MKFKIGDRVKILENCCNDDGDIHSQLCKNGCIFRDKIGKIIKITITSLGGIEIIFDSYIGHHNRCSGFEETGLLIVESHLKEIKQYGIVKFLEKIENK